MNDMLSPTIRSNRERHGLDKGTFLKARHTAPIQSDQQVKDRVDKWNNLSGRNLINGLNFWSQK